VDEDEVIVTRSTDISQPAPYPAQEKGELRYPSARRVNQIHIAVVEKTRRCNVDSASAQRFYVLLPPKALRRSAIERIGR
jgi:hypothetical protein